MKPIIAMTGRISFFEGQDRNYDNRTYFDAIAKAGGTPLCCYIADEEEAKEIAKRADGLVITGGADVNPSLYHEEKIERCWPDLLEVDKTDITLLNAFMEAGKPIFAICKGIQILNVGLGGTLYQDINTQYEKIDPLFHQQSKHNVDSYATFHHFIAVENTLTEKILGKECEINSFHHQAIKDVAPCLTVSGYSHDGLIEAVEWPEKKIIGVQWHPERLIAHPEHMNLFTYFVNWCK